MQQYHIMKNQNECIFFSISNYHGKDLLDIRTFFKPEQDTEEFKPTKKGINISVNKIDEMIENLQKLKEEYQNQKGE